MRADKIKAIGSIRKTNVGDYKIKVLEINKITSPLGTEGVEVLAQVWDKSDRQIGFGKDGSVDIERFRIFNPPTLVDDPNGDIVREFEDISTRQPRQRRLKEDPKQALLNSITSTVDVKGDKFDDSNIQRGKRGNTTSTFYPATGSANAWDTFARIDLAAAGDTWSTMRNSATGVSDSSTQAAVRLRGGTTSNQWRTLDKGIMGFDTSSLGTDTISSATLSLYGDFANNTSAYGGLAVAIDKVNPASETSGTTSDANASSHDGVRQADTDITFASWDTAGYNDFTLNATGRGNIDGSGNTWLSARPDVDLDDSEPTYATTESDVGFWLADQTGTSNDPKLVVEHSAAAGGATPTPTLLTLGIG